MSYRDHVPNDTTVEPHDLVFTAEAAKAIGVSRGTLNRYRQQGKVTPEWCTPGGAYKWDVEKLKRQVRLI